MTVSELVLSLFPGVGLLDRAFSSSGFIVVQAQDKITGGDIREFAGIKGRFDGIIAGPTCQGFSVANNKYRKNAEHRSVRNSRLMLWHAVRIITECQPEWFLIENVPTVPDVRIAGYDIQRIPITDFECGGMQLRSRHIQFGSRNGDIIRPERVNDAARTRKKGRKTKPVTTKTDKWTDYPDLCRKQGLAKPIELPGWCRTAKFRAVGNGVPLRMGKTLAKAVVCRAPRDPAADCQCGCGRTVSERALTATASCRKRKQLADDPYPWVDIEGYHA
jgi:DNA (cytosine-5)-methyltransferase 1